MYRRTHLRQPTLADAIFPPRSEPRARPDLVTRAPAMPADPLPKLRSLCLAFPASAEKEAWGAPTFRAKDKLFAMYASAATHHGGGRPAVWIKARPENQALVIADDPDRYFKPPYVGPGGWIGVWLDRRPPWKDIAALLEDGFRQVAPKKVLALLDAEVPVAPGRQGRG